MLPFGGGEVTPRLLFWWPVLPFLLVVVALGGCPPLKNDNKNAFFDKYTNDMLYS